MQEVKENILDNKPNIYCKKIKFGDKTVGNEVKNRKVSNKTYFENPTGPDKTNNSICKYT